MHQVLAFARKQPDSLMVKAFELRTDALMAYVIAHEYGPEVLEPAELADRMAELTDALYLTLGRGWIEEKIRRTPNDDLWEFQEHGSPPSERRSTPACWPEASFGPWPCRPPTRARR